MAKASNNKKQKLINVALAVFGVSIVVFAVIGAYIIDNFSNLQQLEDLSHMDEETYKGEIDDRLRFIALQDENIRLNNEQDNNILNEQIEDNQKPQMSSGDITLEPEDITTFLANSENNTPKTKFEEYNEKYKKRADGENDVSDIDDYKEDLPYKKIQTPSTSLNLKVVIGDFSTKTAAEQELTYISSQFSTPPFIRTVNGAYVIQVAAFKTPETAYEYVNSLRQQGYTARIVEE